MKKIQKQFIIGAALLASTGIVSTVNADTTPVESKTLSTKDNKASVTKETVKQQTELVAKAKENLNKASNNKAKAEEKLAEAQKDSIDTSEATIAKAQSSVTDAQKQVAPAKKTVEQEKASLEAAKKAEMDQQELVKEEQNKLESAKSETETAKKSVEAAQKELDSKPADEKVQKAKEELDKAQKRLTAHEEELKQAEVADAKRQSAIDKAEAEIKVAQAEIKEKQKKVSSQDQVQNTFTLSQNYIKAVKSIRSGSSSQLTDEAKEVLYKEASVLKTTNNYISSKKDAERIYDINSIPKDVLLELNFYTQDLINQIRKQAGTSPVTVTQNSMDYAAAFAQAAREEKYKYQAKEPITSTVGTPSSVVAKHGLDKFGFRPTGLNQLGFYPTLASQEKVSVDYLKQAIYNNIKFQLFDLGDSVGDRSRTTIYAQKTVGSLDIHKKGAFLAVSYSNNGIINRVNILLFYNYGNDIKDYSKITPALINPNTASKDADASRKDLAASQAKLETAQRDLKIAKNKNEAAPLLRQVVKTAKDKVAHAEKAYQKALKQSKDSLSEDTKLKLAALTQAKDVFKDKEASQKSAQANLDKATEKLTLLRAKTTEAQTKVAKAETSLAEAKKTVQDAKDYLSRLKNAPALLKEAEQALRVAKADLFSKEEIYKVEAAKLEGLLAAFAILEKEQPSSPSLENGKNKAELTNLTAKTKIAPSTVKKDSKPVSNYQAPTKVLPNTGSNQSSLSLAGLGLLSLLGLAVIKRSKD